MKIPLIALSLTVLGTLHPQIGEPAFNLISQNLTNSTNLARDSGTVTIANTSLSNIGDGTALFAEACGPMFIGTSTIYNSGIFAKGAAQIDITNSQVSNVFPGNFGLGLNWIDSLSVRQTGTLTINSGGSIYNSGRFAEGDGVFVLNGGTVVNDVGQMCLGMSQILVNSGQITSSGEFGRGARIVQLSGGSIFNMGSLFTTAGTVNLQGSSYVENLSIGSLAFNMENYLNPGTGSLIYNEGLIGPLSLNMQGGAIVNNGDMYLGRLSLKNSSGPYGPLSFPYAIPYTAYAAAPANINPTYFTTGSVTGSGNLYLSGTVNMNMPVTQGKVVVGQCYSSDANFTCSLSHSSTLSAQVIITGSGTFYSTGTVIGDVEALAGAKLSPGGMADQIDALVIQGDLTLQPNSVVEIDFDNSGNDKININGGNLYLTFNDPRPILYLHADSLFTAGNYYNLIDLGSTSNLTSGQKIYGQFSVLKDQPLINLDVGYGPDLVYLLANYNPFVTLEGLSNVKAVAAALDTLNGYTNNCLQSKIDEMILLNQSQLDQIFSSIEPEEYKGEQIVLEELVFAANNELIDQIWLKKKGISAFVLGGYRRLNETSFSQYVGFKANTGYEALGVRFGSDRAQVVLSMGALETSTKYKKITSKSTSGSVFGDVGFCYFDKRWAWGFDGLYAYNFITNERKIQYFDLMARSNHGGYIFKGSTFLKYAKKFNDFTATPYDKVSFLYNHENGFVESGASCLGLNVHRSDRKVVRNDIGFTLDYAINQAARPYIDLAYVYEYRFGASAYRSSFINTDVTFTSKGLVPSKNFAKYAFGLKGAKGNWDYRANFEGMYSTKLRELEASLYLSKKF